MALAEFFAGKASTVQLHSVWASCAVSDRSPNSINRTPPGFGLLAAMQASQRNLADGQQITTSSGRSTGAGDAPAENRRSTAGRALACSSSG